MIPAVVSLRLLDRFIGSRILFLLMVLLNDLSMSLVLEFRNQPLGLYVTFIQVFTHFNSGIILPDRDGSFKYLIL